MSTKIKPYLWKRLDKTKKYPITIRVTVDRKSKFTFIGYSIKRDFWLKKTYEVSKSYENHEYVNALIKEKQKEIEQHYAISPDFKRNDKQSFIEYFDKHIRLLELGKKISDSRKHKVVLKHIKAFLSTYSKEDLLFKEITTEKLRELSSYFNGKKLVKNTQNGYFKKIKHLYNQAIKENIYVPIKNAFDSFDNESSKPNKTALDFTEFKGLMSYNPFFFGLSLPKQLGVKYSNDLSRKLQLIRNLFVSQFYLHGIRVSDFLMLKWDNVTNRKIIYKMRKTGAVKSILLTPSIIEKLRFFIPQERLIGYLKTGENSLDIELLFSLPEEVRQEILFSIKERSSTLFESVSRKIDDFKENLFYFEKDIKHQQLLAQITILGSKEEYRDRFIFSLLTTKDIEQIKECLPDDQDLTIYKIIQTRTTLYNRDLKLLTQYEFKDSNLRPIKERLTSHLPRHTFSTICMSLGLNPYTLSQALEHEDFKTTENYIKSLTKDGVDEEIDTIFQKISEKNVGVVEKLETFKKNGFNENTASGNEDLATTEQPIKN